MKMNTTVTIKGKYNIATLTNDFDETSMAQIRSLLNMFIMEGNHIVIMPDAHAGSGICVGFTQAASNKYVIPNLIGCDIGCGIRAVCLGKIEAPDLPALDEHIKKYIPSGFNKHSDSSNVTQSDRDMIKKTCDIIGYDMDKAMIALGTLGGGNHFIELDYDSAGKLWLLVHSGSRHLGLMVNKYFNDIAKAQNKGKKFYAELPHLDGASDEALAYYACMKEAQEYAARNRYLIIKNILKFFGTPKIFHYTIDTVHNYVGDDGIIRKGAISAYEDEFCVIPLNSVYGTLLCRGRGNPSWNFSAPHGAGRVLSRGQAKKQLSLENLQGAFKDNNIYTSSANISTLDESFEAYKKPEDIINKISETVDIVDLLKPIYNFKAGENGSKRQKNKADS